MLQQLVLAEAQLAAEANGEDRAGPVFLEQVEVKVDQVHQSVVGVRPQGHQQRDHLEVRGSEEGVPTGPPLGPREKQIAFMS